MKPVEPIQYQLTPFEASPTAREFIFSPNELKFVTGPFGSGKSSMCAYDLFITAFEQPAAPDGVRYTRFAVIRGTYSDLVNSAMKSWTHWIPEYVGNDTTQQPFCPITRPMNGSPTGKMHMPWFDLLTGKGDGSYIDMEVIFISCDDPRDVGKLRSTDFTKIWFNELSMFDKKTVFDEATARHSRFPAGRFGKCRSGGVIGDTNPPDTDHWFYELAEVQKPNGFRFFRQPPALIEERGDTSKRGVKMVAAWGKEYRVHAATGKPCSVLTMGADVYTYRVNEKCENVNGQPKGEFYWLDQADGKSRSWIRVYLMNEYGTVENERPVFQRYNDDRHCAKKPLVAIQGLPLIVSLDFGMTPAAAICQLTPMGQFRVIDELTTGYRGATCESKKYLREFLREILKPHLLNHYKGMRYITPGDPIGGTQRGQTDGLTCYQVMFEEGFDPEPMSDYGFQARVDAVNQFLEGSIDRGEPAFLLSPKCVTIRKAFITGYNYPKTSAGNEEKSRPAKDTIYSHVMDGVEGACLYVRENNMKGRGAGSAFGSGREQSVRQDADYQPIV